MTTEDVIERAKARIKAKTVRAAERTVPLDPSAFADDCMRRPAVALPVGLRRLSEADLNTARACAAKLAWELHPEPLDVDAREECYTATLMRWAVARGTCRPDDVSFGFFKRDEDDVRADLSPQGVKFLYEQVERFHIEMSPLNPLLGRPGIVQLAGLLLSLPGTTDEELFATMPAPKAARLRRLLGFVLDELSMG